MPGGGGRVVGWGVAGSEVDKGDFVGCGGGVRWCIKEGAVTGGGDRGVVEDLGKGETEGRDDVSCLESCGEVELVEDIGFEGLD